MTHEHEAVLRELVNRWAESAQRDPNATCPAQAASDVLREVLGALDRARSSRDACLEALRLVQENQTGNHAPVSTELAAPAARTCSECPYRDVTHAGSFEVFARCDHPDVEGNDLPVQVQPPEWCPIKKA